MGAIILIAHDLSDKARSFFNDSIVATLTPASGLILI
jgi:hypothetical protein